MDSRHPLQGPQGHSHYKLNTNHRTMLDLIKPKLVYLDTPLFMALLTDLFPGVEPPPVDGGALKAAIEAELREAGLQVCNPAAPKARRCQLKPIFKLVD